MKSSNFFTLVANANNQKWVSENLDSRDYKKVLGNIHVYYFNEMQKSDILSAIKAAFGKLF